MASTQPRLCRRCLLRDMAEEELYLGIREHVARIPPEQKVSEAVLEQRLTICASCDELISGMCRLCGCYVELRAAMKIRSCPHVPAKWSRECLEEE